MGFRIISRRSGLTILTALTLGLGTLTAPASAVATDVTITLTGVTSEPSATTAYLVEYAAGGAPTVVDATCVGAEEETATCTASIEPTDPATVMIFASNAASGQVGSAGWGMVENGAISIAMQSAGITGTVEDEQNRSVSGANISFNSNSGGFFTKSDSTGRFASSGDFASGSIFIQPPGDLGLDSREFTDAPDGAVYTLLAQAPGGGGDESGGGGPGGGCDPSSPGAVTGTVIASSTPVSNATVFLGMVNEAGTEAWDVRQGTSGEDGTFCIDATSTPDGTTPYLFATGLVGDSLKASAATAVSGRTTVELTAGVAVAGTAVAANDDPLGEARVTLRTASGQVAGVALSASDGTFAVGVGSFAGAELLEIRPAYGSPLSAGVPTFFDIPHSGDAYVLNSANFQGRVFDSDGTTPLVGAQVNVMNGPTQLAYGSTDANGAYGLYVDPADCSVDAPPTVSVSGGASFDGVPPVGAPISADLDCDSLGGDDVDFTLATANYRGQVVDVDGATPVSGAQVRVQEVSSEGFAIDGSWQTQTSDSGSFALDLPFDDSRRFAVTIAPPWGESTTLGGAGTTYIGVLNGEPAEQPVELSFEQPNIQMMLKLANSQAARGAFLNINAMDEQGNPNGDWLGNLQTDNSDGSAYAYVPASYFTSDGVGVRAEPPSDDTSGSTSTTFTILVPMTSTAAFMLDGANARVLVLGPGGDPLEWSWVNVSVPNRPEWYGASTNADGYALFNIDNLDLDRQYRVQAQVPWGYRGSDLATATTVSAFTLPEDDGLPFIEIQLSAPNLRLYIETLGGQALPFTGVELRRAGSWESTWLNANQSGVVRATIATPSSGTVEYELTVRPFTTVNGQILADRTYSLEIDDQGVISITGEVADEDGYFTLTPAAPNLLVKVVDPAGDPQRWSWVDLFNTSTRQWYGGSSTQADGTTGFAIDTEREQTFELTARAPWGDTDVSDSQSCTATFLGDDMLSTTCEETGNYLALELRSPNATITVTDGTDPVPYAGVCASNADQSSWTCAQTNPEGLAVMNLPADDAPWNIEVQPPWGETSLASAQDSIDPADYVDGSVSMQVALGAPNFSVTVLAGVNTVPWAYVSLIDVSGGTWTQVAGGPTGESGIARLGVVVGVANGEPLPANYCLDIWPGEAAADGYAHYFACGDLVLGDNSATLQTANVTATVYDSSGADNAWGAAWFEGDTEGTSTWANIDGTGSLQVYLADGTYTATIYPGPGSTGVPKTISFTVIDGSPAAPWSQTIELSQGKLNGTVTDVDGNPVPAGFVFAEPTGVGDTAQAAIRSDGTFSLALPDGSDLPFGTYAVTVVTPDGYGVFAPVNIVVGAGGTLESGSLNLEATS